MSAAPHKYRIGIFSPALDKDGNSIAGLDLLRDIFDGLELDVFD
jgi:glutaminase